MANVPPCIRVPIHIDLKDLLKILDVAILRRIFIKHISNQIELSELTRAFITPQLIEHSSDIAVDCVLAYEEIIRQRQMESITTVKRQKNSETMMYWARTLLPGTIVFMTVHGGAAKGIPPERFSFHGVFAGLSREGTFFVNVQNVHSHLPKLPNVVYCSLMYPSNRQEMPDFAALLKHEGREYIFIVVSPFTPLDPVG